MIEHVRIPTSAGTFDGLASGPADARGVLLLHGFPEAATEWEHQLTELGAAGYRAVAPDQRGYSPDVRPERVEDYRMEELVGDVLAMADQLGWSRFDLVGHDWGAAVAWAVAAAHPDRLRTLTAVSVPHPEAFRRALKEDEDQQRRSAYIQVFQQAGTAERTLLENDAAALRAVYEHRVPASRVEDYVMRLSEPGALTAALNWYRAMKFGGPRDTIIVPTLFVWSTEDVALGSTGAFGTEQWVDAPYRFEVLEDVSHWVPEEAAEKLTALLLEHLAAH
ncbi:alpha/beta fold hydrolase [Gandjariella thermophila]|uniref:Haloalkane dehalogenase n=1 Tax=Gandjariella thermophila TaxID=1931992 RepID=A0A4D4J2L1_9PSEU|nr:alpha/beta hydrolase [Gandjariella thermophila]GDY29654.1 haloalkane dehalogenase [Gandjariella thermophila]